MQASRAPGAVPTGNLVAQMFRMPAQAVSAEARGQFAVTAGKVGNTHSFHLVRGAARLLWPDTHTRTSVVNQEQFSVGWQSPCAILSKHTHTQVN